ncbi:hypothetical protein PR202_gb15065 [Eleusine coracana subsp. coracana]|uniref:C2 domain-containing protein n=1 Tax=Eleusine coracana subsp. coracana TaxID=191504 RepID=A0AAV5EWW0_ELECO|nr:hypothetical protein PR202_gb15065 [Eleusine coracana subsp. coracana]
MASTSAPAIADRVAPQRAAASFAPARSLAGCRAVVWRCWGAGRGRRRRWAGLRARCGSGGGQSPAVQPGSQNSGKGLMAEGGEQRPPFDLNLAVVLAGFAFEAYTSPPGTSDPYVVLQLNGQTVKSNIKWAVKVSVIDHRRTREPTWNENFTFNIRKSRENLLQVAAWDANLVTPHKRMGNSGLYLESLCDGNNHDVTVDLEGLGGGGTIELEVKYKSYDAIEREKQWWRIPFVSDFLVKSSLGSALKTILGSESINASQFVKAAFGQLSSFTYTYLPKPSSLDGFEVSKSVEETPNESIRSNELQQQKIDYADPSDSCNEAHSPGAVVNGEGNASPDVKESDEYFWRALSNVLDQNVLQNFGFSLPEVKQLDGFDLLSSLGLKSRERAEQKYLESGLVMADTSTSNGSETTSGDAVGLDNENKTLTTKEEVQASFPDISKVSRDVLSQTENILGALMILSKNFSPQDKESITMNEADRKDEMIGGQGAAAADLIDDGNTVASTEQSIDAQKAEDMRRLFASAETAMEAWAMLATSLGRNSFIKSDFEKICFLDNVSTDTQVSSCCDTNLFAVFLSLCLPHYWSPRSQASQKKASCVPTTFIVIIRKTRLQSNNLFCSAYFYSNWFALWLCVYPMQIQLDLGVAPFQLFPRIDELEIEIAAGTFLKQSQVRIMGAGSSLQDPEKTTVTIDLVPLGQKFDRTSALLISNRFLQKKVPIKSSIFGDYDVTYVHYPGE